MPLSCGRVIVATWHPHETTVVEVIRDLGLELQVIFNKDAVMVLPSGVNKATGLSAALDSLGLSPHNVVGVGDAENDHAFLNLGECAVAVANALPMVQERADWTTQHDHGAGVSELIDRIVSTDLADLEPCLQRHHILLGTRTDNDAEIFLKPYGVNVLLAPSGGGKTTLATGIIERLIEQAYQVCVIDPEGDYAHLEDTIMLGSANRSPDPEEVLQLLEKPQQSVVINLLGSALEDRPAFFHRLLPRLQELRARTGHPHWIVVDETHHLLPGSVGAGSSPVATVYVRDDDAYRATTARGERGVGIGRRHNYHRGGPPRDIASLQRHAGLAAAAACRTSAGTGSCCTVGKARGSSPSAVPHCAPTG